MVETPLTSLNDVLAVLGKPAVTSDKVITGLTLDSRTLAGGELFIAVPGFSVDGRQYIEAAVSAGASAVLAELDELLDKSLDRSLDESLDDNQMSDINGTPVIFIPELKQRLGFLADQYYRQPSKKLNVIGVTGTNGKTSCCWYVAELLSTLNQPCALMGTIGNGVPPQLSQAANTTADAVSLHQFMARQKASGVQALAMEVSSHGLDQGRVDGVAFDIGVFTNISRDHLDYHGSIETYAKAKSLLFADGRVRHAVINCDDAYSGLMMDACAGRSNMITYSTHTAEADVYASSIKLTTDGLTCSLQTPWGDGELRTSLLGRFNLDNLLAAISSVCILDYPLEAVLAQVSKLTTVPGRMQRLGGDGKPLVIVDYAHTPDALDNVLSSLREHGADRLTCLFGCGGDRDRGKRSLMMKAAISGADRVVLTSDNPRSEDPERIMNDALEGVDDSTIEIVVIPNRAEAIARTVAESEPDDIVVVAGKGHEDYQEIDRVRIPFDDREHVSRALSRWGAV